MYEYIYIYRYLYMPPSYQTLPMSPPHDRVHPSCFAPAYTPDYYSINAYINAIPLAYNTLSLHDYS